MYKCPRCGYLTKNKSDLKKHFQRKNSCPNTYANISISECLETFFFECKKNSESSGAFTEFFTEFSENGCEKAVKSCETHPQSCEKPVHGGEKSVKSCETHLRGCEKAVKNGKNAFPRTHDSKNGEGKVDPAIFFLNESDKNVNFFPKLLDRTEDSDALNHFLPPKNDKNAQKMHFSSDFSEIRTDSSEKNSDFCPKNGKKSENPGGINLNSEDFKNSGYSFEGDVQNFSSYFPENLKCNGCNKFFKNQKNLKEHIKKNCRNKFKSQNIYKFDINLFGKALYGEEGGNIYIIKTDFENKDYWHIGITNSIYNKIKEFQILSNMEPFFFCYYPINFAKKVEFFIKKELGMFNIGRDSYNIPIHNIRVIIKAILEKTENKIIEIQPEIKINEIDECLFCNLVFDSKLKIFEHQMDCIHFYQYRIKKNNQKEIPKNNSIEIDKDKIISELQSQIKILLDKVGNVTYNSTNNNIIVINAFGKENTDYINKDYIRNLIQNGPYGSIPKLVKQIYFNPHHRENHNIRIPNKRDKYAMVFDGKQWILRNKKNTINTMADNAYGMIAEHCSDICSKKISKFIEDYECEEKNLMKRLAEDMEIIILNGQREIGLGD